MTLSRNIIANYASQLYVIGVGILVVPLYIKYMGPEAYGLVGFFAMLQVFFNMLDLGLTPTMARESARYHGGAMSILDYRRLARALEGVFAAVALLGGTVLFTLASPISTQWLNASQLSQQEIALSLQIMAIIVALRWMCGLYKGVITGAERLVWLSGFNSIVATGRFVLVLPLLMLLSASPQAFFTFQLGIAILEIAGLIWMAYRLLPPVPKGQRIRWEWAPLKPVLKFSLTIAFTSSVWVLVTQTDKLVLSMILPLADYGYFTVAVLVASSIMIVSGPISSAVMPRMARLEAEGQHDQLITVYRQATQLAIVIAVPVALVLVFFSKQVLWAWTGDVTLVEKAAPVLTLYAAGYGILVASAFPYYLQYAKGDLKLHLIGNGLFVLLLIPSIIWAAIYHGMVGAGWAWVTSNIIYFLAWVPVVHRRFAPGIHWVWLQNDVVRPLSLALLFAVGASLVITWTGSRVMLSMWLISMVAILLLLTYTQATQIRYLVHLKYFSAKSHNNRVKS